MKIFNITERFLPYLLPFLLILSRTSADLTVIAVALLFIMKSYFDKNWIWLKEPWLKFVYIFIFYLIFINSSLSIDPQDSLVYSISFLRWPIFCIALYFWLFKKELSIKKFFYSTCLFMCFFTIYLWYQFLTLDQLIRLTMPLSDNLIPGRFVLFFYSIILTIFIFSKNFNLNTKNIIKILFILYLGLLTVLITGERMVFLIFISSIVLILTGLLFQKQKKLFPIIFFIFLTLVSLYFIALYFPEKFQRSVTSSHEKIMSFWASDYGSIFKTAYYKWINNPIVGGGLHQYRFIDPQIAPGLNSVGSTLHAHNLPLGLLTETGIIGLILFYSIIIKIYLTNIHTLLKENFLKYTVILNLLIIYFLPFISHFSLSHNWINATIWLILGFTFVLKKNDKKY